MKIKQTNQKGFTIIEVLIVLAIAGLIMLVVFLAVPALQRNQRNGGRRTDASRLAAAANDFVTNSNGTTPSSIVHGQTIKTSAGTLSTMTALGDPAAAAAACTATTMSVAANDGNLTICTTPAASVTLGAPTKDSVVLATGGQCSGSSATATGSTRQMAIFYTQETGSGFTVACINI